VAYPWHPLYGQRVRVNGRQGRAGRQILYIEVQPGLSREIPAWMCDAAACAEVSCGSPRLAIAALTELRAVLDSRSGKRPWRQPLIAAPCGPHKPTAVETIKVAG
jgi:hypothetical protein